jgi:hypothetical protein
MQSPLFLGKSSFGVGHRLQHFAGVLTFCQTAEILAPPTRRKRHPFDADSACPDPAVGFKKVFDIKTFEKARRPGGDIRDAINRRDFLKRSHFKTPSNAQWRRCIPLQNVHILLNKLRFFIRLRLALERDLRL